MSTSDLRGVGPYRGLTPFGDGELDALLFFGREREREIVVANLIASRLTVLYGPSGVGKSSLLRAGVARALRGLPERPVVVVFSSWAEDPGSALAAAVCEEVEVPAATNLQDALAAVGDRDVYLILDQAEEYFLYHGDGETAFEDELSSVVREPLRVNVLLSLREDALAKLDRFKGRIPNLFGNSLRLDRLDREAARAAIVRPVERWNEIEGTTVEVEPALVEAVLDDVGAGRIEQGIGGLGAVETNGRGAGIEAPYLQLVMQRLWEVEHSGGSERIRVVTLGGLGGAPRIVADHLERALTALTPEQRDLAAALFNHLVTPSGTKIAHGLDDLAKYAGLSEDEVRPVVRTLAGHRILRPDESGRYEIFHDVLAGEVLAWRARWDAQRELDAARVEAEQRRRRAVAVAAVALVALVVIAAIAIFALAQRTNARHEAKHARARELSARALLQQADDPQASVELALAAARLERGEQTEEVLRSSLLAARLRKVLSVQAPVTALAFSPDGGRVAIGTSAGVTQIWDPLGHRAEYTFPSRGPVHVVAFDSRRSRILAAGGGSAAIWDVTSRRRLFALRGGGVNDAVFSRDGRLIVAAGSGGVRIWRARDGRLLRHFGGSRLDRRVAVSSNGQTIAVIEEDRMGHLTPSLYDARTGRLLRRLSQRGARDIEFSPDGKLLASASADGTVILWTAPTGRRKRVLDDGGKGIRDLEFSHDGSRLATGSSDDGVRVWRVASGDRFFFFGGHVSPVTHVTFDPTDHYVVSTSEDRTTRIYATAGAEAGLPVGVLAGHRDVVATAAYAPDGRTLVTGGEDGTARIWDTRIEQQLRVVANERAKVSSATFDGRLIVDTVGSAVHTRFNSRVVGSFVKRGHVFSFSPTGLLAFARGAAVTVESVPSGRRLAVLHAPVRVAALAFRSDGRELVAAGSDGSVLLWDLSARRTLHRFATRSGITSVALSPNGEVVLTGDASGIAHIWSAAGALLKTLSGHPTRITDARFDLSGTRIVTASEGSVRNVIESDVRTGHNLHVLVGHSGTVTAASFSSDGRWIVTAGPSTAGIWSAATGHLLFYLRGPTDLLTDAEWAPDGYRVLTSARDGTVRVYDCEVCGPLPSLIALARARLAAAG